MNLKSNDRIQLIRDSDAFFKDGVFKFPENYLKQKANEFKCSIMQLDQYFETEIKPALWYRNYKTHEPKTIIKKQNWVEKTMEQTNKCEMEVLHCLFLCSGSRERAMEILFNNASIQEQEEWQWTPQEDAMLMDPKAQKQLEMKKGKKWVDYRKRYLAVKQELENKLF